MTRSRDQQLGHVISREITWPAGKSRGGCTARRRYQDVVMTSRDIRTNDRTRFDPGWMVIGVIAGDNGGCEAISVSFVLPNLLFYLLITLQYALNAPAVR